MVEYYDFEDVHDQIDDREKYNKITNTPWYPGAEYDTFSDEEFERRYSETREKMDRLDVDCLVVPGGPHHWSFGHGMLWLSGHWNWHAMVEYVVVPREGDPVLVYTMGGPHIEATRRVAYPDDVRPARSAGSYGTAVAEVVQEKGYEKDRVGITMSDNRFDEHVPVNHYEDMLDALPDADVELLPNFFHELMYRKSPEEQEFVDKAGELCVDALYAIRDRAEPGVTEYELAASAARAIEEGGGQVDFLIIGSTPMDEPAQVFGNPRPSHRELQEGDIIMNELAAGYNGYTAQIGIPVCVGEPTDRVREFFDDIVLPGFYATEEPLQPGNDLEAVSEAGGFFREHGVQSRSLILHGIDLVSNSPHVTTDHVGAFPYEEEMKPGAVYMLEPCPITADGRLGMFYGHTYIMTEDGPNRVTDCPHELLVADW